LQRGVGLHPGRDDDRPGDAQPQARIGELQRQVLRVVGAVDLRVPVEILCRG
jgi:hypothetical protein